MEAIASETLQILDRGCYSVGSARVSIAQAQRQAVDGTTLFRPQDLEQLSYRKTPVPRAAKTKFSVTNESTQEAARRLVQDERVGTLAVLNFASAKKVGGGFLRGAKAQEEDIVRSCGLFRCLESQPEYYRANQSAASPLYTDHIIYSPAVPWFRAQNRHLLAQPFTASIITAPAPNAKEYFKRGSGNLEQLQRALTRRAGYILDVALTQGDQTLLLGAWGCGVFQNDPTQVAATFMSHLESRRFRGRFEQVVFAVFDPSASGTAIEAFRKRVR